VRKKLRNEVRVIREVLINVKRRDFMSLNFNELARMVSASKGGQVVRK